MANGLPGQRSSCYGRCGGTGPRRIVGHVSAARLFGGGSSLQAATLPARDNHPLVISRRPRMPYEILDRDAHLRNDGRPKHILAWTVAACAAC